jgi:prepilin-type N-terminal cleavage/methylation domain-containing protein
MSKRPAFTLIELLIVIAIIGSLIALIAVALQMSKVLASRHACANNLHNIGVAIHLYEHTQGALPRYRLCPAPWRGAQTLIARR